MGCGQSRKAAESYSSVGDSPSGLPNLVPPVEHPASFRQPDNNKSISNAGISTATTGTNSTATASSKQPAEKQTTTHVTPAPKLNGAKEPSLSSLPDTAAAAQDDDRIFPLQLSGDDLLSSPLDAPLASSSDAPKSAIDFLLEEGELEGEVKEAPIIGEGSDDLEMARKSQWIPSPDSSSGMKFNELYRLKGVLGTGAFSTVREGKHRRNNEVTFAIKCVNRSKLTDEDAAALLDEVAILKELNHEHIIRLFDFFEEPSTYYLVMERMCGGELFDRIVAKAYYNEKEARDVCKIVLEAVGYCHSNHVAHRDLKPENLLLLSESDDSAVKIADFGFAKKVLAPKSLTTQCGTPGYVAPEILEGIPYDTCSDMWSVGVILYILLGGYPPFIENNQRELFRKIRKGDYEFHEEYWGTVSSEAKGLIKSLLTVDPSQRLTAADALRNPWICGDDDELAHRDLGVNLQEFKRFNAKRKFKAAVSTVMAVNKLQSLGKDFLKNLE